MPKQKGDEMMIVPPPHAGRRVVYNKCVCGERTKVMDMRDETIRGTKTNTYRFPHHIECAAEYPDEPLRYLCGCPVGDVEGGLGHRECGRVKGES